MQVGALYKYKALVSAFSRQCVTSRRFVDSTIIFLHLWPTFFIFIAPEYFLWSVIAGGGWRDSSLGPWKSLINFNSEVKSRKDETSSDSD